MINLTNNQKIYIACLVVGVALLIVGTCFFIYKKIYTKKRYHETIYLKLDKMARLNDYLLLNNYRVEFDDTHFGVIDHILISHKYIFVINDFDLSGVVSGDLKDQFLRVVNNENEAVNISNPLNYNINLIKRINMYHRLDQSLIKGLVVIQNNSEIRIGGNSSQFMMIRQKDLKRVIAKYEKDDVKPLKEGDVVNFINKLNKENEKKWNHQ